MKKILHIVASPRETQSKSNAIARAYLEALGARRPDLTVDTLDIWREALPEFEGNSAEAKLSFFGAGTLEGKAKLAWDRIIAITERFKAADHYVLGVPMWNGGVPYRLKLYIDIITQPGLLFGFDPQAGYHGLLSGKSAFLAYSSGVFAPGVAPGFGIDFHSTYLDWWLRSIGIDDIRTVRFQPSLLAADPARGFAAAMAEARAAALA